MTAVATPAGAVSRNEVDWHAINWQKAHTIVRRLQARIVKATQACRWGKVRALQRLLTHSFSAKVVAVKRVTENRGKRTPGVDGVIWETPEKAIIWCGVLMVVRIVLRTGSYSIRTAMPKFIAKD